MHCSVRGVILSLLLVVSIFSVFSFFGAQAQENLISAKSIGFEETTIIEFKNSEQSPDIDTVRMWLGTGFTFKSFKTEKGWTGQKTPEGLIVFTTTNPLKPGEVVKFGIKTDKPKPGINWRIIDVNEKDVGTGKTIVSDSASIEPTENSEGSVGILQDSSFRMIPEKPNVGSSLRVTGDNFGANKKLDFYIGNNKITSFETDDKGHFMITSSIPETQPPGRVDFIIKDSMKNEKSISLRVGESADRVASENEIRLTISATPPIVFRGDSIKVTGTGMPGSTVTATIKDTDGNILTTIAIDVDFDGNWKYEGIIAPDTPFGKQTAEITDGIDTILRSWTVESSKVIEIAPTKLKFEPGEIISFNGTALPNQELEIVVEDPQGTEFYTEFVNVGSSGQVSIEIPTQQSSTEGTYILFASQGENSEIIFVGLGEFPVEQLIIKMDKLNYASSENATINLIGPPSSTLSLLIVDPSDKTKFSDTVNLEPDGSAQYELDLEGYSSGVYTVVITRANAQTSEVFSIGLLTGSGEIIVRTTKDTYQSGESLLILGESGENILLTLTLIDPDGQEVKIKETFTNKDGVFSESSFRIPTDAKIGTWIINVKSGPNFYNTEITVIGDVEEGLVIFLDSIQPSPTGKIATFNGYGAAVSQGVIITIISEDNEEIDELTVITTGIGEFSLLWIVPNDLSPGTYTIKAKDPFNEAETTMVLD